MRSPVKLTLMTLLVLGFALPAQARGGKFKEQMMKELDLSEQQAQQLQELKKSNKPEMKSLRGEMKAIREKMQDAMAKDASESELRSLHNQKFEIRKKLSTARFEKMLAIRKILTPDQRVKFQQMMKEKRKKRRGKRDQ